QMYVCAARADIFHPGGFSYWSSWMSAASSSAYNSSAGARRMSPLRVAFSVFAVVVLAMELPPSGGARGRGALLQRGHAIKQRVDHHLRQRGQECLQLRKGLRFG